MASHTLDDIPEALRGAAVVIGNFDGVHKGHGWVLEVARGYGLPVVVLTFEPHPRAVLLPQAAPFRLTSASDKAEALAKAGSDAVVILEFDQARAAQTPEAFIEEVLVGALSASVVVVGQDYRFGRQREGGVDLLRAGAGRWGYRLVTASAAKNAWGERYSSSRIRDYILRGDLGEAQRLLGRPWTISGRAEAVGDGSLRLAMGDYLRPPPGRYAVTVRSVAARPSPAAVVMLEGQAHLRLEGDVRPGPLTLFLHQRLGEPDARDCPAEGVPESIHIFYAAE
jgi:riboflavin kinase / FMN adenylyltransferase